VQLARQGVTRRHQVARALQSLLFSVPSPHVCVSARLCLESGGGGAHATSRLRGQPLRECAARADGASGADVSAECASVRMHLLLLPRQTRRPQRGRARSHTSEADREPLGLPLCPMPYAPLAPSNLPALSISQRRFTKLLYTVGSSGRCSHQSRSWCMCVRHTVLSHGPCPTVL